MIAPLSPSETVLAPATARHWLSEVIEIAGK
jgi:hypothetical protein